MMWLIVEQTDMYVMYYKLKGEVWLLFHRGNPGPNVAGEMPESDEEYEFFRFEKVMK